MANETSGAYFTANAVVDLTAVDTFIPEIWSDEVIAAYKVALKMAPLVKRIPFTGKKGDKINIPKPVRGAANAKAEATAVTIQANLEQSLGVDINRHFEYSRLIEDIVDVQALNSLRQFYTDDAGYALALQVDDDLIAAATGFGDGTLDLTADATGAKWVNSNAYYFNASSGLATYAVDTVASGDNFTDLGFREAIKLMDDANVPMDNRVLIIPPAARKSILGLERYVSSDFRDDRTVQSGLIGNVYGVDVYVSSNCPVIETAAENGGSSLDTRGCIFMHRDALVLAEQMSVRSQTQYKQEYLSTLYTADTLTQYKQEYLSTLYTADTLYGVQAYRPEAGFILALADE
jgi:N4-gp56 family major capsid protein